MFFTVIPLVCVTPIFKHKILAFYPELYSRICNICKMLYIKIPKNPQVIITNFLSEMKPNTQDKGVSIDYSDQY